MIKIIAALDESGLIGKEGRLPWHCPADLKRFRALTLGHTVICGRKTADTLPPLPGRNLFVMSRRSGPKLEDFTGEQEDCFVIGGAEIYKLALPLADEMYLTRIQGVHEGDCYFPEVNWDEWNLTEFEMHDSVTFQKFVTSAARVRAK